MNLPTSLKARVVSYVNLGNHSTMYMCIKSAHCTLKIETIIFGNYSSINLKKQRNSDSTVEVESRHFPASGQKQVGEKRSQSPQSALLVAVAMLETCVCC